MASEPNVSFPLKKILKKKILILKMQLPRILQPSSALAFLLWCTSITIVASSNNIDHLTLLAIVSQLHDPLGVAIS